MLIATYIDTNKILKTTVIVLFLIGVYFLYKKYHINKDNFSSIILFDNKQKMKVKTYDEKAFASEGQIDKNLHISTKVNGDYQEYMCNNRKGYKHTTLCHSTIGQSQIPQDSYNVIPFSAF